MHDPLREEQRDDPDRNIDEKDPVPTVVVSNPAAKRWANCGGDDNRHTINRKAHVPLFGGEGIGKDRLFAWSETSASEALHRRETAISMGRLVARPQSMELSVKSTTHAM